MSEPAEHPARDSKRDVLAALVRLKAERDEAIRALKVADEDHEITETHNRERAEAAEERSRLQAEALREARLWVEGAWVEAPHDSGTYVAADAMLTQIDAALASPVVDAPEIAVSDAPCECGHTADWHADDGKGDCEGSNIAAPGSFAPCECDRFLRARGEDAAAAPSETPSEQTT